MQALRSLPILCPLKRAVFRFRQWNHRRSAQTEAMNQYELLVVEVRYQ